MNVENDEDNADEGEDDHQEGQYPCDGGGGHRHDLCTPTLSDSDGGDLLTSLQDWARV